jgi:hypothetical protein
MKKCVWCSEPITERRGFKEIPFSRKDNRRKGWAHNVCWREQWSLVCFELPGICVDKNGLWIGWAKSENNMAVKECFAFAVGELPKT